MTPNIQARAQRIESHGRPVDLFEFASPQEFLSFVAEESPVGLMRNSIREEWAGIQGQTGKEFASQGYSTRALALFREAQGKLASTPVLGSILHPAVAGGAWIIPLVLQSSPMPARMKKREKLPPMNLTVRLDPIAYNDETILAQNLAKITRALWDYQLAGGVVSLTVFTTYNYRGTSDRGTTGFLFRCNVPITSESSLSLGCSVPFVRVMSFALGGELSPRGHDESFPVCKVFPPDEFILSGDEARDKANLQKFLLQA
jgi:hypothetical protein